MIDLASISPAAGAKYSPNLHRWMKREFKFGRRAQAFFIARDGGNESRSIIIGYEPKSWPGDVIGATLSDVLSGGRVREGHYTGERWKPKPLPGFLQGYAKWGRCYIDPSHTMWFRDPRWTEHGDRRVCLWCGISQRKETRERVVVDERWVAA